LEITVDIISILKHFGLCFGMKSNGSLKKEKKTRKRGLKIVAETFSQL
jgi:hypothetical protein